MGTKQHLTRSNMISIGIHYHGFNLMCSGLHPAAHTTAVGSAKHNCLQAGLSVVVVILILVRSSRIFSAVEQ